MSILKAKIDSVLFAIIMKIKMQNKIKKNINTLIFLFQIITHLMIAEMV